MTNWHPDCDQRFERDNRRMENSKAPDRRQADAIKAAVDCMGCMHEGMIVTDPNGVIVETNIATDRILEAPSLGLKGTDIRKLCAFPMKYDELIAHAPKGGP